MSSSIAAELDDFIKRLKAIADGREIQFDQVRI
jgi:hypothetical protein